MRKSLISIVAEKTNSGKLIQHLGLTYNNPIEELQLNRKNYAPIRHTDTVINGIKGTYTILSDTQRMFNNCHQLDKTYTMEKALKACEVMRKQALLNYKYSMQYFKMLSKREFDKELKRFKEAYPHFVEVTNINDYKPKRIGPREWKPYEGIYILVLKKYKQIYVGQSNRISTRIKQHWGVKALHETEHIEHMESGIMTLKDYSHYTGANEDNSVMKIDAFGPLDTSQIYFMETKCSEEERKMLEAELINFFDKRFLCNRLDEYTGQLLYRADGLKAAKEKLLAKAEKQRKKSNTVYHFGVRVGNTDVSPEDAVIKFSDYFAEFEKLGFMSISDLTEYANTGGMFILVLEKFNKVYIGESTKDIRNVISSIWTRSKDSLENVEMKKLKISHFRPLDTTQIYVLPISNATYKTFEPIKAELAKVVRQSDMLNRSLI